MLVMLIRFEDVLVFLQKLLDIQVYFTSLRKRSFFYVLDKILFVNTETSVLMLTEVVAHGY